MEDPISKHVPLAEKVSSYLTNSPDPYWAVSNAVTKLKSAGYQKLNLRQSFTTQNFVVGGKYYYTVNQTTLVAFAIGKKYKAGGNGGFKIIGGHTDTPNLKVKPNSKRSGSGCVQLGVECYGGGLWHTWLDRDLSLSGRVLVRDPSTNTVSSKLVKLKQPVARISSLCIHLETPEERRALKLNKEDHLTPILGTSKILIDVEKVLEKSVKDQLTSGGGGVSCKPVVQKGDNDDAWRKNQEPKLFNLLGKELNVNTKDIANFELNLYDTQPATLGGVSGEFLYSARLDNMATCYVATEALLQHSNDEVLMEDDEDVSLICLFDHEEIGSDSAQGAASPVLAEAVKRISTSMGILQQTTIPLHDVHATAIHNSFFLSVDMAHAIHPNYAHKHEKNHGPQMNQGVVLKSNQNQRYSTNGVTGFIARELTRMAGIVPLQEFVVRNDCACGSTIGPIVSKTTGIRTVDLGMPQLSMHSCREVMGIVDLTNGLDLFKAFFKHFREIDDSLQE